jgi:hypothetical protein
VAEPIARRAFAAGGDTAAVARALADQLAGPGLRLALVFADRRLDAAALAGLQQPLAAPVIGCSARGVIGRRPDPDDRGQAPAGDAGRDEPAAVAIGLYGNWLRVGIGIAGDLSREGLIRGEDAVKRAAAALGTTVDALDPGRHVAITLIDGRYDREEAFCVGSAAAAPRIRFIGGCASTDPDPGEPSCVWAGGELLRDAGVVAVLDSDHPFYAVTSGHHVPTELRTVVTAAIGRVIEELDGKPAVPRLRQLLAAVGDRLDEARPAHALARYLDGAPYVRAIERIAGDHLVMTCGVEPGHVVRVMQPGDVIGTTQRALATAATRVGGVAAAFVAFSSTGRHAGAAGRELAAAYAAHHATGCQTLSEQSGTLLVNDTLTGLAIGAPKP